MNPPTEKKQRQRQQHRRLLAWFAILLGVLIALLILIALIVQRIISTDAVKTAIENTVSKELGGTVSVGRLSLVILPRPEIRLLDLAIDVPGAASASAASAGIYARLLPLLWGRFEVSSVRLDRPVFAITLPDAGAGKGNRTRSKKKPSTRSAGEVLTVAGRTMPDLSLNISRGTLSFSRGGRSVLFLRDLTTELAFISDGETLENVPAGTADHHFHIAGSGRTVLGGTRTLPGPVNISIDRFDVRPEDIAIAQSRARLLDMDVRLSGFVRGYLSGSPKFDIALSGSIGQNGANWLRDIAHLPETVTVRAPLQVRDVRLRTSGTGTTANTSLTGDVSLGNETNISFSLEHQPEFLTVERCEVKDKESDAVLRLTYGRNDLELAFTGVLTGATVTRIVKREQPFFRRIAGDMRVHLPRDQWHEAAAEGTLEGEGIVIPLFSESFVINRLSAQSRGTTIDLRPLVLSLGTDILTAEGTASLSESGIALDLDVSADRIDVAPLRELLNGKKKRKHEDEKAATGPADKRLGVEGNVRVHAAVVSLPSYTAEGVIVNLSIAGGRTTAELERATVCGISLKGRLQTGGQGVEIRAEPKAVGGMLKESLQCFLPEIPELTGTYDLSGLFTSRGSWDSLLASLQGNFDITAKQGRIQSDKIVKGIIAYLNSTSLLKDSHTELLQEGFPYETVTFRGALRDRVIILRQGMIKSKDLHIAADGDIDLRDGSLALNVLAAPFTSLDRLLGKIPVLKHIAGNALIMVPVRVEGSFQAPKVRPLPVSGVGTNITNLMKNIVQAPIKIVDPVLPKERDKASAP